MVTPKVLVIGLDGATWKILVPLVKEGSLPTLGRLMQEGVWGICQSTIPPWTIPSWESISTGKSPRALRFATFMIKSKNKFVPHILRFKEHKRIWDILSQHGYKVIIANLPNVYCPSPVNGCIVAGWLYINKRNLTYPPTLIQELNKITEGYEVDIFDVNFSRGEILRGPSKENYLSRCEELLLKHFRAFRYLLKNYEWDFSFLVFVTPDRIQHKYWDINILREHYKKVDHLLGELLKSAGNNLILFIISDHGFGDVKYIFYINELLLRRGYLKLKKSRKTVMLLILESLYRLGVYDLLLRVLDRINNKVARAIKCKIGNGITFKIEDVDWSHTKALAYGPWGAIYINVKGRDPEGTIDPEYYHKFQEKLIKEIKETGRKYGLDICIFKKEEIYNADVNNTSFPDLIILPTDKGIQEISSKIGVPNIISRNSKKYGNHRIDGIFIGYGPPFIKRNLYINNVTVYDLTPTILYLFGIEQPLNIEGRVLEEIFDKFEVEKLRVKFIEERQLKKEYIKIQKTIKKLVKSKPIDEFSRSKSSRKE